MIHELVQGSPEWEAFRLERHGASEAAAMLGLSPYMTRSELLKMKKLGMPREFSQFVRERVLDRGHETEAMARLHIERTLGQDLYPSTHSMGRLSASCDGLTLDDSIAMEHKQFSAELFAAVQAGQVPEHHMPQCQQVLMVTGASELLFVVSDGTPERLAYVRVYPDEAWFQRLRDGWAQFDRDLAAYELPAAAPAAPLGKTPDTLPALRIEVTGAVTASNLAEFKATALATIRSVNRELKTDQDFADAERAVKWCSDVETRLKAAKEHALSQTADIDALFKALDDIGAEARTVRLDLDKLVARRKTEVKEEAVAKARRAFDDHIAALNAEIAPFRLPVIAADFAGTIKGLKSVSSMQDKLDGLLATVKVAAEVEARGIRANVAVFKAEAEGFEFLFADLGQLVYKAADDFRAAVSSRIAVHRAAEERKAREKAEAEARAAEAARKAAEEAAARASAAAAVPAPAPVVSPPAPAVSASTPIVPPPAAPVPAPRADEPATLKLGDINARIAPLKLDAAGMAELGIQPARSEGSAKLYRESDFDRLLRGIVKHIQVLQQVPA